MEGGIFFSINENLVLWARSETIGSAGGYLIECLKCAKVPKVS